MKSVPAGGRGHLRATSLGLEHELLGSLTALLRKEVVGVTPDGLRINWHVTAGSFVGPGLDARILPGAADWMRIRHDGVAIVNVQACLETDRAFASSVRMAATSTLARRLCARVARRFRPAASGRRHAGIRDRRPAPRVAQPGPVYRRGQGGHVDAAGRVRRLRRSRGGPRGSAVKTASLYTRLGERGDCEGHRRFRGGPLADKHLGWFFPECHAGQAVKELEQRIVDFLCEITGGEAFIRGRDMRTAHKGLGITEVDWTSRLTCLRPPWRSTRSRRRNNRSSCRSSRT